MKIKIAVTKEDLDEMACDSLAGFERAFRNQLDAGVVTDDGGVGADWLADYELEVYLA